MTDFRRETDELVPFTVTDNGAAVTDDIEWAAVPDVGATRPIADAAWHDAVVIDGKTYFPVAGLAVGGYSLFARYTVGDETPVRNCGSFRIV